MKFLLLFYLFSCVSINTQVNALYCYSCEGEECKELTDNLLVLCDLGEDTTSTTESSSITTETEVTSSTINGDLTSSTSSVVTSPEPTITTTASTVTRDESTTAFETTDSSNTSDDTTDSSTINGSSTLEPDDLLSSTDITNVSGLASDNTSNDGILDSSSSSKPTEQTLSTDSANNSETVSESSTKDVTLDNSSFSEQLSTDSTSSSEAANDLPTKQDSLDNSNSSTKTNNQFTDSSSFFQNNTDKNKPTSILQNPNSLAESLSLTRQATNHLIRNYRSIARNGSSNDSYRTAACYTILANGAEHRGCVKVPVGQDTCQAVRDKVGVTEDNGECLVCQMDRCNSSARLSISFIIIMLMLLGVFV